MGILKIELAATNTEQPHFLEIQVSFC